MNPEFLQKIQANDLGRNKPPALAAGKDPPVDTIQTTNKPETCLTPSHQSQLMGVFGVSNRLGASGSRLK